MGILDDAIKEHLELKRSHGASDDEIRRKEEEVFGAPTAQAPPEADEHSQLLTPDEQAEPPADALDELEPLQPAPEDPYAVHPGDDLVPDPDVPTEHYDVPPAAEAGAGTIEPDTVEPGPPGTPRHHHHDDEQHPALVDHDHIGGEEHPPEPVFRQSAAAPVEEPPVEEPPVEEPPVEEPGDPETDEDVLEETPEFLQDAPEHDRLWFEQKPPRDFDFGE
jgi:hypothetical protein